MKVKICAKCQKQWTKVPENSKFQNCGDILDGIYWDCDCKSTLFIPLSQLAEMLEEEEETSGFGLFV
jgi:hypothetical protein